MMTFQKPSDASYDTIVIGGGAAGIMAACTLGQAGQSVLLMEKGASLSASGFARCGGPAACETSLQQKEHAWLPVKTWFQRLELHLRQYPDNEVNETLLYHCLAHTAKAIDLLTQAEIPMVLLPDTYQCGYRARHFILADAKERASKLEQLLMKNGVECVYRATAEQLLQEGDRVTGVLVRPPQGESYSVHSRQMLLCTGGFLGNKEYLKRFYHLDTIIPLGSTLCQGDGIRMALNAGARLGSQFTIIGNEGGGTNRKLHAFPYDKNWKLRNENLEFWIYGGLIVDSEGKRFINEAEIAREPLSIGGITLLKKKKCYCILDQECYEKSHVPGVYNWYGRPESWAAGKNLEMHQNDSQEAPEHLALALSQGWGYTAASLVELKEHFGLTSLPETVEQYNALCRAGADSTFHKDSFFMKALSKPPYYAFEYEPASWGTQGGICVSDTMQVQTKSQCTIPGLYMAGVDIGNLYANPYYPGEGCSVGIAMGSGIYAAECILSKD